MSGNVYAIIVRHYSVHYFPCVWRALHYHSYHYVSLCINSFMSCIHCVILVRLYSALYPICLHSLRDPGHNLCHTLCSLSLMSDHHNVSLLTIHSFMSDQHYVILRTVL